MSEPLDLRLASGALAGWAAVLWGLERSAAAVALAVLGAVLVAVVLGVAARWWPVLFAGAFAACCAAVLLAPLAVRLHAAHDGALAGLAQAGVEVSAELRVRGDPRPLGAGSSGGSPTVAVDAQLLAVLHGGRWARLSGAVLVLGPADAWRGVLPGQRVRLDGRLRPPLPGNLLAATVLARSKPELLGRPPWWQRGAGRLRSGLRQAAAGLPVLPRGLLPGLVEGDTSELDPVLAERFRVAGLSHLTAVSGTNLSLLIGTVALLLRRVRASPAAIALVSTVVLVGFVVLARPSPSVLRAAVMAGIALVALATGRQRAALPVLAAASFGLLLWQPGLAVSAGFALSVAATAALLLVAPGWVQALRRRRVPAGLAEALAVAAAAHLATAPIIAGLGGRISLVAIPANVLAEPVVATVTILGLLAALASVLWLPLAVLLAQLAGWPCRWLVWVAKYFGSLPGASLPWPAGVRGGLLLAGLSIATVLVCRRPAARALLGVAVVLGVLIQIPGRAVLAGWPPPGWLVVACDVGQGDALALNAGRGSAVVIDAGPDPVPVDRCLHELGITRVTVLVLSHDHLDHVGGLAGVLHGRQVDRVLVSPLSEPASGNRLILSALAGRHLRLEQARAGQHLDAGQSHLDVLGPGHVFAGSRSDPNNSSVVLRATVAGVRILLPGDAEVEAQDDLLGSGADLRADILKVPHHGSAYSDPAFLQASQARLALISVGAGNDYGHPSPVLIAELARLGMPFARTDQQGDIAVVNRAGRLVPVVRSAGTATGRFRLTLPRRQPLPSARAPPLRRGAGRPARGRDMAWSIAEVARMSGVSSRTLRHYDEIGLLPPAQVGANGYRYYAQAELLRLQQILLLRELGLGLADIRSILDSQLDAVQALRAHHRRLLRERDRLTVLAHTVARTIDELTVDQLTHDDQHSEEGTAMARINRPENLFEGFDPSVYDEEARRRWPAEWEQSQAYAGTLTEADTERLQREMTAAMIRMAELMVAGAAVDSAPVQAEIDAAYRGVCRFWTPDAAAFTNLGRMYVEDQRFKANYDRIAEGLAEFYRDAMAHYADTALS